MFLNERLKSYLWRLDQIIFPGSVLALGVDIDPDRLVHVVRVLHLHQVAPTRHALDKHFTSDEAI